MSGPRLLIFHDRSIGDMTLSETPRFMTPRVSIYDLLSAMEYRGPVNSTILLISSSVYISCLLHCIYLYCTNTLHVPLIIEHLAIASEECFVGWLVLPFREKNKFI